MGTHVGFRGATSKDLAFVKMAKISTDHMRQCINQVLEGATEKKREFMETIELQIGLKNYDPQKDKRFAGTIKLPHIPRPKLRICILGDAFKNKKLIKKFAKKYQIFL